MTTKARTLVPFLLFLSIFLLSTTLALSSHKEERELQQCKQQCQQQAHYDQGMRKQCELRCEDRHREQEREREREHEHEHERDSHRQDPEQRLEQCQQECRQSRQGEQQQWQCQQRCEERYQEERREQERGQGGRREHPEEQLKECRKECEDQQHGRSQRKECEQQCEKEYQKERQLRGRGEQEEEWTGSNPYVFRRESFRHRFRTQLGNVRVLQNFFEKSELLMGIANYRLAILEANPNTFVMPNHWDADAVIYVVRGECSIHLLRQDGRESHNLRQGDIIRVLAGTIVYLVNRSSNQKLYIAKLLQPVSTPGSFQEFYTVGGGDPESFYQSFSNEVLEAALNTPREKVDRLFGRQQKGPIVEASQEQIRAMSSHSSSSERGPWPFGGESKKPFNLLNKRPTHSNERGQLYEADCNDYGHLRDLDVQISFANISRGSMTAPYYNSRATKVALVVEGRGYLQMVCPHLSSQRHRRGSGRQERERWGEEGEEEQEQEQRGQRYQRVESDLTPGTGFIVPPGHPIVTVASREGNLQVICFEIHAENNRRTFLAGKNNIVNQMEREAKELSFNVPAKLVEEVFSAQQQEAFLPGPEERREEREKGEGGRRPLESILDFAGF